MCPTTKTSIILGFALGFSSLAFADHNSPWGEGWANMPNDIQNTRIDTRGDNGAFRDFVRYGAGSTTVNRFNDNPTTHGGRMASNGNRGGRAKRR